MVRQVVLGLKGLDTLPLWLDEMVLVDTWHCPPSQVRQESLEDYERWIARRRALENIANAQRLGQNDETIATHNPESDW